MKDYTKIILSVLFSILFFAPELLWTAEKQIFDLTPQSQIVLKGTSNINKFSFVSKSVLGRGCVNMSMVQIASTGSEKESVHGFLAVGVETFDSDNPRMNRDMYNALKIQDYSHITFEIESVKFSKFIGDSAAQFKVYGFLTVAGVEKFINLFVSVSQHNEHYYQIYGQKQVHMTDYAIDPPQALLGLIQVKNSLSVEFDIFVERNTNDTIASDLRCDQYFAQFAFNSKNNLNIQAD